MKKKIKLTLVTPEYTDGDTLYNKIKKILNNYELKKVGLEGSYTLTVKINDTSHIDLSIGSVERGGYDFKMISIEVSKEHQCFEIIKKSIIEEIMKNINGVMVLGIYDLDKGCKLTEVIHGINYSEDSYEHDMIHECLEYTQEPIEALFLSKMITDKKEIFIKMFDRIKNV